MPRVVDNRGLQRELYPDADANAGRGAADWRDLHRSDVLVSGGGLVSGARAANQDGENTEPTKGANGRTPQPEDPVASAPGGARR